MLTHVEWTDASCLTSVFSLKWMNERLYNTSRANVLKISAVGDLGSGGNEHDLSQKYSATGPFFAAGLHFCICLPPHVWANMVASVLGLPSPLGAEPKVYNDTVHF